MPDSELRTSSATIKLNGSDVTSDVMENLLELRVQLDINLPSRAVVRFADDEYALYASDMFSIGRDLDIALSDEYGGNATVINGEIVGLTVEQTARGAAELEVTALDKSHRLARTTKARTYLHMTDSDIVNQIASDHGLHVGSVAHADATHEYLIHPTDDYSLLTQICRRHGWIWRIDGHDLHVERPSLHNTVELKLAEDILRFRLRQSAVDHVTTMNVRSWDPDNQTVLVGKDEPTGGDGLLTSADAGSSTRTDLAPWTAERTVYSGLPDQSSLDALAKGTASRAISGQIVAEGKARGNVALKPGVSAKLTAVNTSVSGSYFLSSVEHIFAAGPLVTTFSSGPSEPAELVDLLATSPIADTSSWGRHGVAVGTVTSIKDPKEQSRVKVMFPVLSDQNESTWARVVAPSASDGFGFFCLPEVNDEVVVAFENGDLNRPYILGGVHSSGKKAPTGSVAAVDDGSGSFQLRTWKSRTGHVIEMADATGEQAQILLKLGDGSGSIQMNSQGITIKTQGKLSLQGDKGVEIKTQMDGSFEAEENLSFKTTGGNMNLQSGINMALKAQAQMTAEAAMASIKAQATLELEATGPASLKGALVKLN